MLYIKSGVVIIVQNVSTDGLAIAHQESITLKLADFRSYKHFSPQTASCYGLQILL